MTRYLLLLLIACGTELDGRTLSHLSLQNVAVTGDTDDELAVNHIVLGRITADQVELYYKVCAEHDTCDNVRETYRKGNPDPGGKFTNAYLCQYLIIKHKITDDSDLIRRIARLCLRQAVNNYLEQIKDELFRDCSEDVLALNEKYREIGQLLHEKDKLNLSFPGEERSEAWDDCNMTGVCDRQQFNDKEKKYVELSDRVELLVGQVIPLKQAYVHGRLVMPENYCRPQPS